MVFNGVHPHVAVLLSIVLSGLAHAFTCRSEERAEGGQTCSADGCHVSIHFGIAQVVENNVVLLDIHHCFNVFYASYCSLDCLLSWGCYRKLSDVSDSFGRTSSSTEKCSSTKKGSKVIVLAAAHRNSGRSSC